MERYLVGLGALILAIVIAVLVVRGDSAGAERDRHAPVEVIAPRAVERGGGGADEQPTFVERDRAGEHRLEGLVLDAAGAAVAGVTVTVSAQPARETASESDGSFAFDGLIAREYTLVARSADGVAGPVTMRLTATSEPVTLRLRAGAGVGVEVVDAGSGAPVAGAEIQVRGLAVVTATAGGDGRATVGPLVPGRYQVSAVAPGYARTAVPVVAGPDAAPQVRIAMRRGAPVEGRVVGADGRPVAGAQVSFQGASDWTTSSDPRRDAVVSGGDGSFGFAALPAGSFRFTAIDGQRAPGTSAVFVLDGVTARAGVEIRLDDGAAVRGTVVSAGGQPLGGAVVHLAPVQHGFLPEPGRVVHADDAGGFAIGGLPRRDVRIHATHEAGTSEPMTIDLTAPPHERAITLTATRTQTIEGVVVDTAGEPVEGAQVTAGRKGGVALPGPFAGGGGMMALTDAGGRFALRGVGPGVHEVRASPPGAERFRRVATRRPIEAAAGARGVRIVLPGDGAIVGKLAFADGGAPAVFAIELDGTESAPFVSDDGTFVMRDVPPGTYALVARGPGFLSTRVDAVEVEADRSTELGTVTVKKGRYLAGRVVRGGQPVAGALVRAGASLYGTGSTISAQGVPGGAAAKETRTGDDGSFRIQGLAPGGGAVIAEHPEAGRSAPVVYGSRGQSVEGLVLELVGFGALEGTVRRDGAPLARVAVAVQSLEAEGLGFTVVSGADGGYRFDRLAAGTYKVSATVGSFTGGMGFHSVEGTVAVGATTQLDLTIDAARLKLTVRLVPDNADHIDFSFVNLVGGRHAFTTSAEVGAFSTRGQATFAAFAPSNGGRPVTLPGLREGEYTVCATTLPNGLNGASELQEYYERENDRLLVQCAQVRLAAQPDVQDLTLSVLVPARLDPIDEE